MMNCEPAKESWISFKIPELHSEGDKFCNLIADVTAIIFVVACSSYNLVLREDPSQVSVANRFLNNLR